MAGSGRKSVTMPVEATAAAPLSGHGFGRLARDWPVAIRARRVSAGSEARAGQRGHRARASSYATLRPQGDVQVASWSEDDQTVDQAAGPLFVTPILYPAQCVG